MIEGVLFALFWTVAVLVFCAAVAEMTQVLRRRYRVLRWRWLAKRTARYMVRFAIAMQDTAIAIEQLRLVFADEELLKALREVEE